MLAGVVLVAAACAPAPPAPPAGPPNLLLVSLDTVRADHTSAHGYARDTTPVLAALAAEGTVFDHAFSQANESAWSHAALLTGRYASELARPVYATYALPDDVTLAPEALRAYGYATAAFSAGGHVTADFGYDQGWDTWSAEPGFASLFDTGPKAAAWVAAVPEGQPWFAFVHGYDAHRPYARPGPWDHLYAEAPGSRLAEALCRNPCLSEMVLGEALLPDIVPSWFAHQGGDSILDPETYRRLAAAGADARRVAVTSADKQHVQDHYDGALRYADTMLGVLLDRLRRAGDLDHTVVLVVSDHGEDLLDHGYMNHRTGLTDSCTRVPMVAWGPGFSGGGRVDTLVDARDVARTLFAVGGALPPAGSGGRDLRAVASGEAAPLDAVFAEGVMDMLSVRTATHRLVAHGVRLDEPGHADALAAAPLDGGQFVLHDLRVDPAELHDARAADPATTAELRDRLVVWRRSLRTGDATLLPEAVSPEVAAELRRHGYWGAASADAPTNAPAAVPAEVPARTTGAADDPTCRERFEFAPEGG